MLYLDNNVEFIVIKGLTIGLVVSLHNVHNIKKIYFTGNLEYKKVYLSLF